MIFRRGSGRSTPAVVIALWTFSGCLATPEDVAQGPFGIEAPLAAYCQANVKGVGLVDTESVYLPAVVHCENGGAPFEALKAQAIAARSYLYYRMEIDGAIADGTVDQVYSCASPPSADDLRAVAETAGQVLRYQAVTVCAFFVAGGSGVAPNCQGNSTASTEKYVTYNQGKTGKDVAQTTLGLVNPTNDRNRGCLSQLGSRCLDGAGMKAEDIVRFYYGADIGIETAPGACVSDAGVDASRDAMPDAARDARIDAATDGAGGRVDASNDAATDGALADANDAAAPDSAEPPDADANDEPGGDAGTSDAAREGGTEMPGAADSGCACATTGPRSPPRGANLALVALLGSWILRRRRVRRVGALLRSD